MDGGRASQWQYSKAVKSKESSKSSFVPDATRAARAPSASSVRELRNGRPATQRTNTYKHLSLCHSRTEYYFGVFIRCYVIRRSRRFLFI